MNITSTAGFLVIPGMVGYACSKFAAEGFSDGLRRELAPFGINVVVIEPMVMKTPMAHFTPKFKEVYDSKHAPLSGWEGSDGPSLSFLCLS